jgi:hypothetical protein
MSMFRAKKLDIGSFVNIKVIRDHTKRKVFAEHEPERYAIPLLELELAYISMRMMPWGFGIAIDLVKQLLTEPRTIDKPCDISFEI